MNRKRRTKGFTLVEVMVVAVILVITLTVAVSSMRNFYERSRQTARNNVARSLFMSVQNALTAVTGQGRLSEFTTGAEEVDYSRIVPAPDEREENKTLLVSLNAPAGSGDSNKLIELIERYVNDKAVLDDTILIEFNKETGLLLACFYSDERSSLGHGSGEYNVYDRTEASLRGNKVGYYGVENTGKAKQPVDINPVSVRLVDYVDSTNVHTGIGHPINGGEAYGLLTAECMLPEEPESGNTTTARIEECIFTLTLRSLGGTAETLTIAGGSQEGTDLKLIQIGTTLAGALSSPFSVTHDGTTRNIAVYTDTVDGKTRLIFVLDAPHDPDLSISRNYPALGNAFITAGFTAQKGVKTVTADSNVVHALFGGKTVGSTNEIRLTVGSVRHLNNVRYASSAVFEQTVDVKINKFDLSDLSFTPIRVSNVADSSFSGVYYGKNKKIFNLNVTAAGDAGLFAKTSENALVDGVYLSSGAVKSTGNDEARLGGIAGTNEGTITNCSVLFNIGASGATGVQAAGGVAGVNAGEIKRCYVGANVEGGGAAGGIAGECSGGIEYCEVGTASRNNALCTGGVPFYGARGGEPYSYPNTGNAAKNDAYTIHSSGENSGAGGIVGKFTRETGSDVAVSYCVNAAKVEGGGGEKSAGGIAGIVEVTGGSTVDKQVDVTISRCYNAGSVNAETAGGVAGTVKSGLVQGSYNTGLVNVEVAEGSLRSDIRVPYQFNNLLWDDVGYTGRPDKSGGIIGFGESGAAASGCYNAQYAGNPYGGAFGVMQGKVTACVFLRNILNYHSSYTKSVSDYEESSLSHEGLLRRSGQWMRQDEMPATFLHKSDLYRILSGNVMLDTEYVGPFLYKLPYFRPEGLQNDFHRTPYQKLAENYGDIRLSLTGSILKIHFNVLLDERAKPSIVLTTHDNSTVTFDLDASNQLGQMHNATLEHPVPVTGVKWASGTVGEVTMQYTGYCSRVYEEYAEERYRGMKEEYIICVPWDELPNDALWVEAVLSGTVYERTDQSDVDADGNKYYKLNETSDETYAESEKQYAPEWTVYEPSVAHNISNHSHSGNYATTEIVFRLKDFADNGYNCSINFNYPPYDAILVTEPSITLNYAALTAIQTRAFEAVLGDKATTWFALDGKTNKQFPIYYQDGMYHLILYATTQPQSVPLNIPSDIEDLQKNVDLKVSVVYGEQHDTDETFKIPG